MSNTVTAIETAAYTRVTFPNKMHMSENHFECLAYVLSNNSPVRLEDHEEVTVVFLGSEPAGGYVKEDQDFYYDITLFDIL